MEKQTHNIQVTQNAFNQIRKVLNKEPEGTFLRVSVLGGGCSGFQYKFDMDQVALPNDVMIESDNTQVRIDETSLPFLEGSVIDYANELIGASFKVNNPNATASCGCGTSFTI